MRRARAFTLLEAMVVLAMFGIVVSAASVSFVSMLRSTKQGHGALQAMNGTRVPLDFVLDEARRAGGPDLPAAARVLIAKNLGARQTDVLWTLHQNVGYSICAVTSATGNSLSFVTTVLDGEPRCCFEAGTPLFDVPLEGALPAGPSFRRTAVLRDLRGRFLPVFLSGDPSATSCRLTITPLPDIDAVINEQQDNLPDLSTSVAVLADVKRFYIDFDADGVRAPLGALFVQTEIDGDVDSVLGERQRLASNAYDFRVAVGYAQRDPASIQTDPDDNPFDDDDPDEDDPGEPDIPEGDLPLLERAADRGGWLDTPVPVKDGREAPPVMLGIALQTGVPAEALPSPLPWSLRPRQPEGAQTMTLIGRAAFRAEAPP
jgi:prepilin-type N-terminal cleavage/methylation domain-containing protein